MISIKNLSKSFNNQNVITDISVDIEAGETVAIIGPSGGGKSTLLRCINYLDTPSSGTISINGKQVEPKNLQLVRQKVGMVFQQFHLFPHMSVLDNITYGPLFVLKKPKATAEKEAKELLEKVGLPDKANSYPQSLSGGQKQRIAIARALAMHPEVILFDEPTSALDPEMVNEVLQVIKSLSHTGITILIVTHEMGFAQSLADRILFLENGKLTEDASPKDFFNKPSTQRAQQFLENMIHVV